MRSIGRIAAAWLLLCGTALAVPQGTPAPVTPQSIAAIPTAGGPITGTVAQAAGQPAAVPTLSWLRYKTAPNVPVFVGGSRNMAVLGTVANEAQELATGRIGLYQHQAGMQVLAGVSGGDAAVAGAFAGAGGGVAELSLPIRSGAYNHTDAFNFFNGSSSPWVTQYSGVGFTPRVANMNGMDTTGATDTLANWQDYLALAQAAGVQSLAVFGDPNGASPVYDFTNSYWNYYKSVAQAVGGVALDMPPGLFWSSSQAYRNHAIQKIQWATANGLRSSVVLSPFNDGLNFLSDAKRMVAFLKANEALPTEWVVETYDDPTATTPANPLNPLGLETTAGTINSVALWVARNAQVAPAPAAVVGLTAPTVGGVASPLSIAGRPDVANVNLADLAGVGSRALAGVTDPLEVYSNNGIDNSSVLNACNVGFCVYIRPQLTAGAYNPLIPGGAIGEIFDFNNTSDSGTMFLGPHSSTASGFLMNAANRSLTSQWASIIEPTSTTPASLTATCTTGQRTWDASNLWECVATNTWKFVTLQTAPLGTLAYQGAATAAITGGTVDGTAVGATTPAAITGTKITAGASTGQDNSIKFAVQNSGYQFYCVPDATTGAYNSLVPNNGIACLFDFNNASDTAKMFLGPHGSHGYGMVLDSGGTLTSTWLHIVEPTSTTPASSTATCTAGERAWDASYEYRCVAANTWKRAALSAF